MEGTSSLFEPTSSLPIFKGLYLVIYMTLALICLYSFTSVKNNIYAKIQAEKCAFTQQNRRGLNQLILRPVWLMSSAVADVISVPGVNNCVLKYCSQIPFMYIFPLHNLVAMGIGQLTDFTSQWIYRFPINWGICSIYNEGYNMILNRLLVIQNPEVMA